MAVLDSTVGPRVIYNQLEIYFGILPWLEQRLKSTFPVAPFQVSTEIKIRVFPLSDL